MNRYIIIFPLLVTFALSLSTYADSRVERLGFKISGTFSSQPLCDSLHLFVLDQNGILPYESNPLIRPKRYVVSISAKGRFEVEVPIDSGMVRIYLMKPGIKIPMVYDGFLLKDFIAERGDSINLEIMDDKIKYEGRGHFKIECRQKLDSAFNYWDRLPLNALKKRSDPLYLMLSHKELFQKTKLVTSELKKILCRYERLLSPPAYQLMLVDAIAKSEYPAIRYSNLLLVHRPKEMKNRSLRDSILQFMKVGLEDPFVENPVLLAQSPDYVYYAWQKAVLKSALMGYPHSSWDIMVNELDGLLKDKVLVLHLRKGFKYLEAADSLTMEGVKIVKKPVYKKLLRDLYSVAAFGSRLPSITLQNMHGRYVNLQEFKGNVIVIDFWFTGCVPCKTYYQNAVAVAKDYFKKRDDVVFISISVDEDRDTWLRSIKSSAYSDTNAVNLYTEGKRIHHEAVEKLQVTSYPTPMLFDKKGLLVTRDAPLLGHSFPPDPDTLIRQIELVLNSQ